MVSLTTSNDIVADSISVIDQHKVIDWKELSVFIKLEAITNIVGLPIETLNSQQIPEAISSDAFAWY